MKLVEVIRGLQTSDATTADDEGARPSRWGRRPSSAATFRASSATACLMPLINEAIFCLHEGVADAAAIDTIMKLGMNHPMGPLTLADFIGLDTCLYILEVLHEGLGEDKYRPCPLLAKVRRGGLAREEVGTRLLRLQRRTPREHPPDPRSETPPRDRPGDRRCATDRSLVAQRADAAAPRGRVGVSRRQDRKRRGARRRGAPRAARGNRPGRRKPPSRSSSSSTTTPTDACASMRSS